MARPVTPAGRLSFPSLFEPDDNGKFTLKLIMPPRKDMNKADQKLHDAMASSLATCVAEKFGAATKGLNITMTDGSEHDNNDDYLDGWTVCRFSTKFKPKLLDADKSPIEEDGGELYPGCWVRATHQAYAYDFKGKKGASFGFSSVLKAGDDIRWGGRADDSDGSEDFADFTDTISAGEKTLSV